MPTARRGASTYCTQSGRKEEQRMLRARLSIPPKKKTTWNSACPYRTLPVPAWMLLCLLSWVLALSAQDTRLASFSSLWRSTYTYTYTNIDIVMTCARRFPFPCPFTCNAAPPSFINLLHLSLVTLRVPHSSLPPHLPSPISSLRLAAGACRGRYRRGGGMAGQRYDHKYRIAFVAGLRGVIRVVLEKNSTSVAIIAVVPDDHAGTYSRPHAPSYVFLP
ncbi:hypothetical protein R3P38DRAFT_186994 [Favolaschia claudopus]|uniref:Uncharacterized protein n=1 Tax=Favolaschia claudopus TaxID=2862362 RepID=A0AAW0CYR5_9AGAR